jgi:hypothetical protein
MSSDEERKHSEKKTSWEESYVTSSVRRSLKNRALRFLTILNQRRRRIIEKYVAPVTTRKKCKTNISLKHILSYCGRSRV